LAARNEIGRLDEIPSRPGHPYREGLRVHFGAKFDRPSVPVCVTHPHLGVAPMEILFDESERRLRGVCLSAWPCHEIQAFYRAGIRPEHSRGEWFGSFLLLRCH